MKIRLFSMMVLVSVLASVPGAVTRAQDAGDAAGKQLEELVARAAATTPLAEADVMEALSMARSQSRPHAVMAISKTYLTQNPNPPAALLKLIAENTRLAGDYRLAATRYKALALALPKGSEEASLAAAELYRMLRDMDAERDAYGFMTAHGTSLRASVSAKKHDAWYLEMAWANQDVPAVAKWLASCFADQAPLELERLLFWGDLDRLIDATSRDNPAVYAGLGDLRKLAGLIRENPERATRLKFQAETLAFNAAAPGKDAAALEKLFAPVAAAAKAWFDASPNGVTLLSICEMWANNFEGKWLESWTLGEIGKQTFFKQSFARLSDAERVVVAGRCAPCATPAAWFDLVKASSPGPERNQWVGAVPFEPKLSSLAAYKALAPSLAGVAGAGAAIVRSLAAGDDYYGCLKHLYEQESTEHWPLSDLERVRDQMRGIYNALAVSERKPERWDKRAQARIFAEVKLASGSLVAMPLNDAQGEFSSVWESGEQSMFLQCLESLRSVPWSKDERARVLAESLRWFRAWSNRVRGQEAGAAKSPEKKAQWDADVAMMAKIDAAFRVALDEASYDASKAPNALAGHMAELMLADRRKDGAAALAAGRKAYALVRDYGEKNLPYGTVLYQEVLKPRRNVNMLDLQCEALADQLMRRAAKQSSNPDAVLRAIIDAQGGLPGNDWRRLANGAARSKVEAAVAKATLAMLEAGKFDATVLDLYRKLATENDSNRKIVAKLVGDKVLVKHPEYVVADCYNAATKYQMLLAREFPWMGSVYPRDKYFDDMFAEEVARTGLADPLFWKDSRDEARKGANAAAAALKGFAKLPFGYDGGTPVYRRDAFWAVLRNVLQHADTGPRGEMVAAAQAAFGKTRFDDVALPTVSGTRAQWFDGAKALLDVAAKQPRMVPLPPWPSFLEQDNQSDDLTVAELSVLLRLWSQESRLSIDGRRGTWPIRLLLKGLVARGSDADWLQATPALCVAVGSIRSESDGGIHEAFVKQAEALSENGKLDLAGILSSAALTLGVQVSGEHRARIEAVRAKSLAAMGGVIPVSQDDERYPLYVAQADYLAGKEERAWIGYSKVSHLLPAEVGKLDPLFLVWTAAKSARMEEYSSAEQLVGIIVKAVEAKRVQLPDAESRARLDLILADVALAREIYPTATELYQSVAQAEEYATTRARVDAVIGVAEVLRRTEKYDAATDLLEDMLRGNRDSYTLAHGSLQLARVKLADGALEDAAKYLEEALQYSAELPDAKLLQGQVNLQRRKLQEASAVEISDASKLLKVLVPGQPLSVSMEDKNLSVVGGNVAIEVRVWTEKGDEEIFNILPFGDSKSKFRGYLPTELGEAIPGDNLLQVLGGDKVRYDYSPRFKKNNAMRDTTWDVPELVIKSDSEMTVSAGGTASRATIRPGNMINVSVVDVDRSMTAEKDEVGLIATASSGDRLRLVIPETEPVSGAFAGALKTGIAPATATAADSREGSDPVFAISGGNHPPWVARPDNRRPKTYEVDMNDNVELKSMTIQADVPTRGLKSFLVQTSMDGMDFRTVGGWPKAAEPWDGSLRMTVMACPPAEGFSALKNGAKQLAAIKRFMAFEGAVAGKTKQVPGKLSITRVDQDSVMAPAGVPKRGNRWYVLHLQGAFILPARAQRTFRPVLTGAGGFLLIDGMPAGMSRDTHKVELTASLEKGVHTLDLYMWADGNAQTSYDIQWDIAEAPFFGTCSAEAFDVTKHPQIGAAAKFVPATVAARNGNKEFDLAFPEGMRARCLRLLLTDFEGDAPALRKLTLHDLQNRRVLPTEMDLTGLRTNDVLEIRPGDKVTITYEDPTPVTASAQIRTAELNATYQNGSIRVCFVQSVKRADGRASTAAVRVERFRPGNKLYVIIEDDDANVSEQADIVPFTVRTSSGREVKLEAVESTLAGKVEEGFDGVVPSTGSGVFIGKFVPVEGEPKAEGEVQLLPNDEVDVVYMDKQNVSPGIPWERSAHCRPAGEGLPEVHVFDFQSAYLPEPIAEITSAEGGDEQPVKAAGKDSALELEAGAEFIPIRRVIMGERRESSAEAHTATGMVVVPLPVEVIWPDVLLSELSRVRVFAQSYESRRLAGVTNDNEFSIDMPGTIVLEAAPGALSRATLPAGYDSVVLRRFKPGTKVGADEYNVFAKGIFVCHIPLALGEPSTLRREDREAILEERAAREEDGVGALAADGERLDVVTVRGTNDGVVIGIPYNPDLIAYENGDLGTNMIVRHYTLHSDPFLDVMDIKYSKQVKTLFMGQTVYLRVIDPAGDVSGEKDSVSVQVTVSGNPVELPLLETYPHSGVFKGLLEMATIGEAAQSSRPGVVGADYGNEVVVTYTGGVPGEKLERSFKIDMGSDGAVRGFTRVFEDPAIAMKTQFTAAESHFKMARSHRKVGMEAEAATELAQGRKLIEEAIRDYPESEGRAQAEYLLAELSLELGDASADKEEAAVYRAEALQRFSDIVSSFPDSEYAPKAQFNKALMLEKLGQIDQACEEYVKLSYKYPGNELVAETIARLGQYFIVKSRELKVLAEAEQDELKKKRLERNLREAYVTAAEVFGRLSERFPDHKLATKTLLLSGQAYLNAKEFKRGRSQFYSVINGDRDDKELVAEAMYWCGDAYAREGEAAILTGGASKSAVDAFRIWKNLTWDYPETKWAKYARGRLGDGAFMSSVNEAQAEKR